MKCPFCGENIDVNTAKCLNCGERLDIRCLCCGAIVSEHTEICPTCNTKIEKQKENKSFTAGIVSFALALVFSAVNIYLTAVMLEPSIAQNMELIPNETVDEKFENVLGLLFFYLFPLISALVATAKKQGITLAALSIVISSIVTLFCIVATIG